MGGIRGKALDNRGLASRLRKYEVHSKSVRIGDKTAKGYRREWLHDLWVRYLPPSPDSADTSDTTSQSRSTGSESVTDEDLFVTDDPSHVTDSNPPNHAQRAGVTDVTDKSEGGAPTNGHRCTGRLEACTNFNCRLSNACSQAEETHA